MVIRRAAKEIGSPHHGDVVRAHSGHLDVVSSNELLREGKRHSRTVSNENHKTNKLLLVAFVKSYCVQSGKLTMNLLFLHI